MNNDIALVNTDSRLLSKLYPVKIVVFLLLIIASVRGAFILNLSFAAEKVYFLTSISLITLSLLGLSKSFKANSIVPTKVTKLMHINLALGILFVVLTYIFHLIFSIPLYNFTASLVYMFMAPFSIFLFTGLPKRYLILAIVIITAFIVFSVISDYTVLSLGQTGFDKMLESQKLLRPAATSLDRIGNYIQPHGYTADKHDSANILGMVFIFFFTSSLIRLKLLDICGSLFSFLALHLTGSAANILIVYAIALSVLIYLSFRRQSYKFLISIIIIVSISSVIFASIGGDTMGVFLKKIDPNSFNQGMVNGLDFETFINSLPFLISGHSIDFGNSITWVTEIGLIKIIFDFGLIPSIFMFCMLLYPIVLWRKKGYKLDALPAVAAILFGFLSLLHYGSLFRITSIFLFFSLYALSLIQLIDSKDTISKAVQTQ